MHEDPFGFPADPEAEAEVQRLIEKFTWAIGDPDTVAHCVDAHVSNTNKIEMNPYRPPRGEAVRRQLEFANIAEWGPVLLTPRGAAGAGPLVVRGRSIPIPAEARRLVVPVDTSASGTGPGACTDELVERLTEMLMRAVLAQSADPADRSALGPRDRLQLRRRATASNLVGDEAADA
jgi:hypothetical protein